MGGIENDPLSQAAVPLWRRWKTDRPHTPTHADDVIILLRRIDDFDLTIVNPPFELGKERRGVRKRRKTIFRDHGRPRRIPD